MILCGPANIISIQYDKTWFDTSNGPTVDTCLCFNRKKKGSSIHLNFLFGLWKVETKAVGGGSPRRPKKIHSDLSPSSRTVLESWGKNTRVKPTAQYEVLVPVPVLLDFFFYFGLLLLLF
jgi:hypothetical protein